MKYQSNFVATNRPAKRYFKWKLFNSEIKGADGRTYFSRKKVKAPESWSQTAVDIAASKYFRKSERREHSVEALIERIGAGFSSAVESSGLLKSKTEKQLFVEELKYILYSQKAAFNSPVWFNLGLHEAYRLTSDSEHFAWSRQQKKIIRLQEAYRHPQVSACFIQSVEDNLESIFDLVKSEAKLFKYGSGSGSNFSLLRGKNELLSSGGTSSGLISFLEVLDKAAGAIKSGGTTRRAAKMVCVDLDHPEVEDFIRWKWHEEKKARDLIASGYSADLDGEAYKTVSGQNANNSVRVPDRFMKILTQSAGPNKKQNEKQNKKWKLINRSKRGNSREVMATDLWKLICEAAWNCADPGLQFDDTINRFHTCAQTARIRASNPCSEYMFLDDSACNLASLNLVRFLDEKQNFRTEEFIHVARTVFIAQEMLVDHASYPTEKIAQNSHDYRPLGLGFANLGSLFMNLAIGYDSDEARAWAGFITALMCGVAYETSADMARELGPFAGYKKNKKSVLAVLKKHETSLKEVNWKLLPPSFRELATTTWARAIVKAKRWGVRNAQATVIAPTGTIGLVMDCDTTGIEPDFSLIKNKKLAGGGYLKIVNQSVPKALQKLGYSQSEIEKIMQQLEGKGSVLKTDIRSEHRPVFYCATGDLALKAEAHLLMMAAVQPFISGAISKTVNLPATASVQDVSETYLKAWKLGLKSIALYRDGSKFVQPLSSASAQSEQSKMSSKTPREIQHNPKCTECGYETVLESGCYRCTNCGTTTACAS
jgi:ribonucleoside-diphosphate reductase alpha chain